MAITSKQRLAMALILLVGLSGAAAVFMSERAPTGAAKKAGPSDAGHRDTEGQAAPADAAAGRQEHPTEHHEEAGEVRLTPAQISASGITVQGAGPAMLQTALPFPGEIRVNEDRTTHVVPRLPGVAEAVQATLGQLVQKGQVLAIIASPALSEQRSELLTAQRRHELALATHEREKKLWDDRISARQDYQQAQTSLQEAEIAVRNASQKLAAVGATGPSSRLNRFEIRSPFAGTVVEKHLGLGEAVKEDASIFTVSDLSTVWAEFAVAPKDLAAVRVGQRVIVSSSAFEGKVDGRITYIGALLGEQARTARARVTLANPDGAWRPGLFVTVAVLGEAQAVPLAVGADALQTVDDKPTLFVVAPGGFVARPVKVGRSDGRTVEILAGLSPGDRYAATQTFVLKSELGKAGAEHGH